MKRFFNTLSGRIVAILVIGMLVASLAVIFTMVRQAENAFIETYGRSQEKVFLQVENNFEECYERIADVISDIQSGWAFNMYFNADYHDGNYDTAAQFANLYRLENDLKYAINDNPYARHVMLVGVDGKCLIMRDDRKIYGTEEILEDQVTRIAEADPDIVHYVVRDSGFTKATAEGKVVMAVKAFCNSRGEPFAYIYITFTQEDMRKFYDFFCSENSNFYITNTEDIIMASDRQEQVNTKFDTHGIQRPEAGVIGRIIYKAGGRKYTVLSAKLKYTDFIIYGVMDNKKALIELYNFRKTGFICICIALAAALVTALLIRYSLSPLQVLADNMSQVTTESFDTYMPVEGTEEIQTLAKSYNYMLDDLNRYVNELVAVQKSKRKAELKALQMQINPHYVYNTLASIKWLIWQREVEKSVKTIDAFIALLRNTISNTDEFITVRQERENVTNYMLINGIRYGERIKTDFFVAPDCEEYRIPKMILQPFVENAFFHGFPSEKTGAIQIFVRLKDGYLQIEVRDNGVGMSEETLKDAKERKNYENYSGIGINNISERLNLIYGAKHSFEIQSKPGEGTVIWIRIPAEPKHLEEESV